MKMLGFMITMTLAYWVMASYAKSVIASAEPKSAEVEFATNDPCDAPPVEGAGPGERRDAAHHVAQAAQVQTAHSCGN